MEPDAFCRRYATAVAVLLGCGGACFTYASFDDPASAAMAVLLLAPCALLVLAFPNKRRKESGQTGRHAR
jgi:hypothetical protein